MTEEAKEARREYHRRYRAAHPEKVREQNRKYWERRAARLKAERLESAESAEQEAKS